MPTYAKLDQFGFLSVTGRDACKFMQGYTTCDLDKLTDQDFQMGAICNLQGRMVTSFLVCKTEDGLLLRMDRALVDTTITFLSKYIVFSKASLEDVSDTFHCYGLMNTEAETGNVSISDQGYQLQITETRAEGWLKQTPASGEEVEPDTWQLAEVSDARAWVNQATTEQFLPQMFNYDQTGAIDFEKGCYLGQEIVARMQYRGELKRRLHILRSETEVAAGDPVATSTGSNLGTIVTTVATSNGALSLAVLNEKADLSELTESPFSLV